MRVMPTFSSTVYPHHVGDAVLQKMGGSTMRDSVSRPQESPSGKIGHGEAMRMAIEIVDFPIENCDFP